MKRCLAAFFLVLAGCVQLPHDLPARPALKTPQTAATLAGLAGTSVQDSDKQARRPTPMP